MKGGAQAPPFSFGLKRLKAQRPDEQYFRRVIPRTGTEHGARHYLLAMKRFRFVTPHRVGKWYADLNLAQRLAETIGAGFLERRTGKFVLYPESRMETDGD